ncbi:hypothetical protein SS50377_22349 [Spironucleus salmonicida]|nr:hypothetical protein SS50377_22349 [Spironucleus salmonicida]
MNLTIIQHDQLSYILQSLFADRLQLTAVTSQFGACYIGILFIEKYLPGKRAVDFLKDYGCEFCQQKGEGFKPRAQFLINKLMFSQQNLLLLEANVSSKYEPKIIENSVNIDKLTIKPAIFDNQKTIIIIDFEAYLYRNDIFIASEFAAVFVEDNKIINTFHSLISPSQQQLEILADPRHQQIIKNTTSLTALNHTNVQGNTLNQIIEQFTILTQQYPSFILTAKAPQLEIQILHSINSPFQYKVTDFLTLRPSLTFKSAHSLNREKFYCNTHTKGRQIGLYGQAVHCALDDCVYLSKLLINEPVAETNFFGEFQNNFIISNNLQVQKSFTTKWPELIAPKFVFSCENNEDLTIILSDFQIIFDARYLIKKVEQQDQLLCSMLFVQSDVPLYCCKLFKQGVETRFFNGIENIPQELMFTEHEFQQIYQ